MAPLKAGAMGDEDDLFTPSAFTNSLASAIEDAYWGALNADGKRTFDRTTNKETDRDRRRIFVAIAQGVVNYLHAHPDAFYIRLPVTDQRVDVQMDP